MPSAFKITRGQWWAASRYELADGRIRVAARATLRIYDPWRAYAVSRTGKGTAEAPYQSLVTLIDKKLRVLPGNTETKYSLPAENEATLLDWCTSHGLLGVLMQRAQTTTLAARWWTPPKEEQRRLGVKEDEVVPSQVRYVRTATGWEAFRRAAYELRRTADPTEAREGALFTGTMPGDWTDPRVILHDIRGRAWSDERPSATWSRFFPNVPADEADNFPYPRPTTKEFSEVYSEPLDDFIDAAGALRAAMRMLGSPRSTQESDGSYRDRIEEGRLLLHALAEPVSPAIAGPDPAGFVQYWVAPSLIGSFAMMLLQDLTSRRRRMLRCEVCDAIFVTDAYQADFCSPTCRRTAYKRRRRARDQAMSSVRSGKRPGVKK